LASFDCVAILTDHQSIDYASVADSAPLVVDTRNAIKIRRPHVYRLGAPQSGHFSSADATEMSMPALV
jgi:UDP-N-acetyl-D-mannosaminuronate dehydrogenase